MKNEEVITRKEYIEREAAIKAIRVWFWSAPGVHPTLDRDTAEELLFSIPAADVREVKRGEWWYRPNIVKIIGSIVVSILLYAVPILTTCAFTLGWNKFVAYLLTIVSLTEFVCLVAFIIFRAEEGE